MPFLPGPGGTWTEAVSSHGLPQVSAPSVERTAQTRPPPGAVSRSSAGNLAFGVQSKSIVAEFVAACPTSTGPPCVLPMPYIAAMYTQAYYVPGVLEMLDALVNPGKSQQVSVVWAMEIPREFIGQPYSELAMKLIRDGGVPLGLLRSPDAAEVKAPLPYVLTLSPGQSGVSLHDHDMVYVVGDRVWAHENVEGQ